MKEKENIFIREYEEALDNCWQLCNISGVQEMKKETELNLTGQENVDRRRRVGEVQ